MIDEYLDELRSRLRVPAERIVAETEDHLRESAAANGEEAAIARFGPPEVVAARFHRDATARETRLTARLLVGTGAVLFAAFLAVDVLQPRAPWLDRSMPLGLEWKLHVAMLLGQVALASGAVALVHAARRRGAAAARATLVALITAAAAVIAHGAFQLDRLTRVEHNATFAALALGSIALRLAIVVAVGVLVHRRARLLDSIDDAPPAPLFEHGWRWCVALAVMAAIAVFSHDEATRARSIVDAVIEAAAVCGAYVALGRRLNLRRSWQQ